MDEGAVFQHNFQVSTRPGIRYGLADVISVFGMNAFLADGDTWKRQRRVLSPAFTKKLYVIWALVFSETDVLAAQVCIGVEQDRQSLQGDD